MSWLASVIVMAKERQRCETGHGHERDHTMYSMKDINGMRQLTVRQVKENKRPRREIAHAVKQFTLVKQVVVSNNPRSDTSQGKEEPRSEISHDTISQRKRLEQLDGGDGHALNKA